MQPAVHPDQCQGPSGGRTEEDTEGKRLIDSLLATVEENTGLDWSVRDAIQARLKVACKRALVHFGMGADNADEIACRLLAWLQVQVGSADVTTAAPTSEHGAPR